MLPESFNTQGLERVLTDIALAIKEGAKFNDNFTLAEEATGRTWVDGKPIYKKTVNIGSLPNNTSKNVAHGITGLSSVLFIHGSYTNGTITFAANRPDGTALTGAINTFINGADITVVTAVDRTAFSGYVTIEYTKA